MSTKPDYVMLSGEQVPMLSDPTGRYRVEIRSAPQDGPDASSGCVQQRLESAPANGSVNGEDNHIHGIDVTAASQDERGSTESGEPGSIVRQFSDWLSGRRLVVSE